MVKTIQASDWSHKRIKQTSLRLEKKYGRPVTFSEALDLIVNHYAGCEKTDEPTAFLGVTESGASK